MARGKTKAYKEQSFDNLRNLDGISDDQISEHLKLYAGYVKQVNAEPGAGRAAGPRARPRAKTPSSRS